MFNDIGRLKALIDLVAEERIAELQVATAGVEFHIALRDGHGSLPDSAQGSVQPVSSPLPQGGQAVHAAAEPLAQGQHVVAAPMPGTFFRAAGAGGVPLVEVGAKVQPGTPVCIVEAMKILNEVAAGQAGQVLQILAVDGEAVEHGQGLFVIGSAA